METDKEIDPELDVSRKRLQRYMAEIRKLFVEVQDYVRFQMEQQKSLSNPELKNVVSKLGELQTLQLSLLRAEETFNDKFQSNDATRKWRRGLEWDYECNQHFAAGGQCGRYSDKGHWG